MDLAQSRLTQAEISDKLDIECLEDTILQHPDAELEYGEPYSTPKEAVAIIPYDITKFDHPKEMIGLPCVYLRKHNPGEQRRLF